MLLFIMGNAKIVRVNVFTNRDYPVQNNEDVEHQYVKMCCITNWFLELEFCDPHKKLHGACGLGKHYHMRFYPKLVYVTALICCIPCVCNQFTLMLDKS